MRIRVLLFAILRDAAAGAGELTLELPDGSTALSAGVALADRHPALKRYLPRISYPGNCSYVPSHTELHDGDELAFIPPLSGGRVRPPRRRAPISPAPP